MERASSAGAGVGGFQRIACTQPPPLRPNSARGYGYTGLHIVAMFSLPGEALKGQWRWSKKVIKKKKKDKDDGRCN